MISPKMDVNTGILRDERRQKEEANSARGIKGDFQEEVGYFSVPQTSLLTHPGFN